MRIQLLLADMEVELTKDVQIPLNKSFEDLDNPTNIIVDYSKNISIPMNIKNNNILGNAYRLDRNIIAAYGNENIGLYLDPTKKIPFRLMYNGEELMNGYAKFTSANLKTRVYNLNLFGILGEFFQKMKDIVTSADRLTDEQRAEEDGGSKYVLNDHIGGTILDASYVYNSWMNDDNNANDFDDETITDQDIIGFAPAYRGYYGMDFKSSEIQVNDITIMSLSQLLMNEWKETYSQKTYSKSYDSLSDSEKQIVDDYVDQLGADDVIGDGMKDYQMDEYRSYHQRPFIYLNKLMYMFKEKSKELTDYDLVLDPAWFNKDNPYWTKLVYMLNYLEGVDDIPRSNDSINPEKVDIQLNNSSLNDYWGGGSVSFKVIPNSNTFNLNPFVNFDLIYDNTVTRYKAFYNIEGAENMAFVYTTTLTNGTHTFTSYCWSTDSFDIWGTEKYKPNLSYLDDSNRIYTFNTREKLDGSIPNEIKGHWFTNIKPINATLPIGTEDDEWTMTIEVGVYSPDTTPFRVCNEINVWGTGISYANLQNSYMEGEFSANLMGRIGYIKVGLDLLYLDESPIFDIILQYTKMYNLFWKLDNNNKTVTICRKSTYFKDYSIENWDDKLDRSKDCIIEPITFDSKYVNFNYEEVDGMKYTAYRDKYGVEYGTKRMKTNYEFDSNDKDLFSKINPSLISQRSFIPYDSLKEWDLTSSIYGKLDVLPRIEAVDSDDSKCINVNSWYFRLGNTSTSKRVYISDDSSWMKTNKTPCWYTSELLSTYADGGSYYNDSVKSITSLPQFSILANPQTRPLGCLFNCPKEDYTNDKFIANSVGRYIYDMVWDDYINERYNVQNKKLTAYFNITPWEYMNFGFDKFVTLDNQLFMVNKIFDYDLNSSATTKCELIQVTDITNYITDSLVFDASYDDYLLTIKPIPMTASVLINGVARSTYRAKAGAILNYLVKEEGYITKTGEIQLNSDTVLTVELEKDITAQYQVTIIPIVGTSISTTALVTLEANGVPTVSGLGEQTITVPAFTDVRWRIELDGYQTQSGVYNATQDIMQQIRLIEDGKPSYTFTINPTPSESQVTINGLATRSVVVEEGARCDYVVQCTGYVTNAYYEIVTKDTTLDIVLVEKNTGDYTFTINPTPSDAFVHMRKRGDTVVGGEGDIVEGNGTQSISCVAGDTVSWSVSMDGYDGMSGSQIMTSDVVKDIVLTKLT